MAYCPLSSVVTSNMLLPEGSKADTEMFATASLFSSVMTPLTDTKAVLSGQALKFASVIVINTLTELTLPASSITKTGTDCVPLTPLGISAHVNVLIELLGSAENANDSPLASSGLHPCVLLMLRSEANKETEPLA